MEAARHAWRRIGELFVEKSLITGEELEQALAAQAASGRPVGEVLVSHGLISSSEMSELIMEQVGRKAAREDGFESGPWAAIRRQTSRMRKSLETADSAAELNRRVSRLAQDLTDTRLALDEARLAHESARAEAAAAKGELGRAEKRIAELTAVVEELRAERDERSRTSGRSPRAITRTLFGTALRLAQE